jgi:glycosyltransferase involved in cell wall biosynthesis
MPVSNRPKILLLIPHLGGGGAERVTQLLARGLSAEKYQMHLGVITLAEADNAAVPPWVCLHALGAGRVRAGAWRLLRLIRRLKPDLILSGMFHLNFLVLLLRPFFPRETRILVRQNGSVSSALNLSWTTLMLYRLLYRHADRVICQSQAMAEELVQELGLAEKRLAVLPNPVDMEDLRDGISRQKWTGAGQHLLAVGRLSREKGFDLLLHAMAAVQKEFPDVSLLMAGAGPEEAALKAECHALGLDGAVRFAGELAQPWQKFAETMLFVLPSRQEGMPNALLEAASAGLPIVALPASAGVVDLMRGQAGVWLAPEISADALAASLLAALHALRPGERFAHSFVEPFRFDRAIEAYENLIDKALDERPQ